MSESIFIRVQRVISSGTQGTVDALERVSGGSLMRQAIREVDDAVDEVLGKRESANVRRDQAARQQQQVRERIATLAEQAAFSLEKGRDDLAEAAITRQLDYEAELDRLSRAEAEAAVEARALDASLAELKLRRNQMVKELAAYQSAKGDAASLAGGQEPDASARRKADRAEAAFDRALAAAGGIGVGLLNKDAAAKAAEVEALQKEAKVADRLAALRSAGAAGKSSADKSKKTRSAKG